MRKTRVLWAFLAVAGMWGSSFLFIELGLKELDPFTLVALRTGFATLALATVLTLSKHHLPRDGRTLSYLLVVGLMNPAIPYVLITWGQLFVPSAMAGIINATVPLFTLPIAHFVLHDERITPARYLGLLIGFLGVLFILNPGGMLVMGQERNLFNPSSVPRTFLGQLAMVAAAICYAGSMVFVRRSLNQTAPEIVAAVSQSIAFLVTTISAFALEVPLSSQISGRGWVVVAWLGISSGLSYILFYFVLSRWGTTRTSLVTYLVPVIAVLLGAIVLREVITWQALAGGVLVIGGIAIINRQTSTIPA